MRREICIAPTPSSDTVRHERTLGVIPARLGSERLPRKPLHPIAGRPLLEWVWQRVSRFKAFDTVVIATDAPEIAAVAAAWGAHVELTSAAHESGTARIAELVARPAYAGYDVVVNVQGDEPLVAEAHVVEAVAQVRRGFDIGTVAAPVFSLSAWHDPAVVKVVRRDDGGALYFSRSAIPHVRDGEPDAAALADEPYLRHIGLYAYRPAVLARWSVLPDTVLERLERLEQLRALAAGLTIGVGVVTAAAGGVDTAEDAARMAVLLSSEPEYTRNSVR
jgi:3-deoxy-manno-octulosonate cytidylyltransferase (CMP-KDO synthetase)